MAATLLFRNHSCLISRQQNQLLTKEFEDGEGWMRLQGVVMVVLNQEAWCFWLIMCFYTLSHLTFPEPGEEAVYLGCFTMDGGAWFTFTFTFHFHALEKEMATHSSVLAWRIPGMVEPGGLPSMGSHRVRHDWSDLATAAAAAWWRNRLPRGR